MSQPPPKKLKEKTNLPSAADRSAQFEEQRRREMATRSILSRFRNRKSPLK